MTILAPAGPTTSSIAPNVTLIVTMAVVVACGVYLMLERSLVRVLLGALLVGNGLGLLYLVVSGAAGVPAFVGADESKMSDPLPQAMYLTAIVISLATIGFLLALSYRLWRSSGTDDVPDDIEDERIKRLAALDAATDTLESGEQSTTESDELGSRDSSETDPSETDARETEGAGGIGSSDLGGTAPDPTDADPREAAR